MFADESVPTAADVTRELLAGAATGIAIKTSRTGFTASQRILGLCAGLGVEVYVGNQIDTQIGSLCAAAFGAAHPHDRRRAAELSNFLDMSDDLLAEPLVIEAARSGPARPRPRHRRSTNTSSPTTAPTRERLIHPHHRTEENDHDPVDHATEFDAKAADVRRQRHPRVPEKETSRAPRSARSASTRWPRDAIRPCTT